MTAEHDVDLLVWEGFFANSVSGVLVEVGAARPDYLSIGSSFRARGWKVISIEPNPIFCAAHRLLGHNVLEYAVSDTEADGVSFFVVHLGGANYLNGTVTFESFSSLGIKGQFAALYETMKSATDIKTITVKVRKLDTILAAHEPELCAIDILSVDVEGWELNVMRGLSLNRYQPKVVILENLFDDDGHVSFMGARGYTRWRRLEPNDVYLRAGA
jgi:FkbM family methyltransferase